MSFIPHKTPQKNPKVLNNSSVQNSHQATQTVVQSQEIPGEFTKPISSSQPAHEAPKKKRKNHRGGKLNRLRKRTFFSKGKDVTSISATSIVDPESSAQSSMQELFYRAQSRGRTSTEADAALDHRTQVNYKHRRLNPMSGQSAFGVPIYETSSSYRIQSSSAKVYECESIDTGEEDERTSLIGSWSGPPAGYGAYGKDLPTIGRRESNRRESNRSSANSNPNHLHEKSSSVISSHLDVYNVNEPPSVPGTPTLEPGRVITFGDVLTIDDFGSARASTLNVSGSINEDNRGDKSAEDSLHTGMGYDRVRPDSSQNEDNRFLDVKYVQDQVKESLSQRHGLRRRRGKWPHLAMLNEWRGFEKEGASNERGAKKITEPQLIGGRLRPIHKGWHRAEDDAPYRFTYFNEQFQSTIHSQTISELVQPGSSFRELFIPDPPELSDSSESDSDQEDLENDGPLHSESRTNNNSGASVPYETSHGSRQLTTHSGIESFRVSRDNSGATSPTDTKLPDCKGIPSTKPKCQKPKRFGDRPSWWLDVLSPTEAEMKVLSGTFGIHPLTVEDILMQEAREKVELFNNYYFVNYRSFEQDTNNEDYLEPVNMYVVVFREGIISFHFSLTPHPANVRRRIRQLKDYLILSSDWISYALIDDITDVFVPLIQNIEDEVDDIDDAILKLHSPMSEVRSKKTDERSTESGDGTSSENHGDMLRRVGDCRKKVMGLYRLLGNKADVIKGFAKRCNENWQVAPRSEIGLYLGDIQDHIVTMTGNLTHYEKILARSHGNYLAQINIRMNERQEQTADVLGKLTVLGTIVLPMNIITGLWGMNVFVPGQEGDGNLTWFWCLTAGLLFFGLSCFMIAKILYQIV